MKTFCLRPSLFLSALLCLSLIFFARPAAAQCSPIVENLPASFAVSQTPGKKVKVVVNGDASSLYGANYQIEFFNSDGESLGTDIGWLDGCDSSFAHPIGCGVSQKKKNVASVTISHYGWQPVHVLGVSTVPVATHDLKDLGNSGAASIPKVSSAGTLEGSLAPSAPEEGQYYGVHLEEGQTLYLDATGMVDNNNQGATLKVEISRDGTTWQEIASGVFPGRFKAALPMQAKPAIFNCAFTTFRARKFANTSFVFSSKMAFARHLRIAAPPTLPAVLLPPVSATLLRFN